MHDLLVWAYTALFWSLNKRYREALITSQVVHAWNVTRYHEYEYTHMSDILSFSTTHPSSIHAKYIWRICKLHISIRLIGRWWDSLQGQGEYILWVLHILR